MIRFLRLFAIASVVGCAASKTPPEFVPWSAAPIAAPLPAGEPALSPGAESALPATPEGALPLAGTAAPGPISFEAAAADGRWIVACQARRDTNGDGRLEVSVSASGELGGDTMSRYLSFASGSEQVIDSLLAASPDGRWLVFERDGKSELYDTDTGARLDLSALAADTRREPAPSVEHRSLAFDVDRLFYARTQGQGFEVQERKLTDGSERTLFRSQEKLVRLALAAGGRKLVLSVAGADLNKNGRFDAALELQSGKAPCQGPEPRYLVERAGADAQSRIVVDRESGEAVRVDDLAAVSGATLLRRDADGALFRDGKKRQTRLADKDCCGRILWLDPSGEDLLLGCALPKRPGRLGVEFVGGDERTPLEIDVAQLAFDEPVAEPARLVALYPGADTVLFDVQKRFLHRLKSGDAVLSSSGARALIRRGKSALMFDAETGTLSALPGRLEPLGALLRRGALVFASPLLVDVEAGRVLGSVSGHPLSLTSSGKLLLPAAPASSTSLAEGPLSWHAGESHAD